MLSVECVCAHMCVHLWGHRWECVCVHVWVHTHVCSYTYVWRWEVYVTCLPLCLIFKVFLNVELINWVCCCPVRSGDLPVCLCPSIPPALSSQMSATMFDSLCGCWDLNYYPYTCYTLNHLSAACVCFNCFYKAGTEPKALIRAKPKALDLYPRYIFSSDGFFSSCGCLTWYFKSSLTMGSISIIQLSFGNHTFSALNI